jgi:dTDP-4-amino-4,6-dideoxygalactose transaminase
VEIARQYDERFRGTPVQTPATRPGATHVFHAYVVRVPERDAVKAHLEKCGVASTIHYPTPLPLLQAYRYLGHTAEDFPVASRHRTEMLTLPLYPEMSEAQVELVGVSVLDSLRRH